MPLIRVKGEGVKRFGWLIPAPHCGEIEKARCCKLFALSSTCDLLRFKTLVLVECIRRFVMETITHLFTD